MNKLISTIQSINHVYFCHHHDITIKAVQVIEAYKFKL